MHVFLFALLVIVLIHSLTFWWLVRRVFVFIGYDNVRGGDDCF